MDHPPHQLSPQWTPRPLRPSPWNTPQVSPVRVAVALPDSPPPDVPPLPSPYLSVVSRPIQEPNDILHDFYNVAPVSFRLEADGSVPRTVDMPLLRRTENRPTHALAVLSNLMQPSGHPTSTLSIPSDLSPIAPSPPSPSSPLSPYTPVYAEPFLLPIDASLFSAKFGHEVARTLASSLSVTRTSTPLVHRDRSTGASLVTLPLIPLYVPHPPSIPHLLLFGQGLPIPSRIHPRDPPNYSRPSLPRPRSIPCPTTLATYLLPMAAIEEFPSAPAMAEVMALQCTEDALRAHAAFNQGLWRNVLLLAPADKSVADLVRVAWNVTLDARRIRERQRAGALAWGPPSATSRSRSPRRTREVEADGRRETGLPAVNVQYADAWNGSAVGQTILLEPVPRPRKPGRRRSEKDMVLDAA